MPARPSKSSAAMKLMASRKITTSSNLKVFCPWVSPLERPCAIQFPRIRCLALQTFRYRSADWRMRSMRSNAAISQSHRPRKEIRMIFHENRLGEAWLVEREPRGDERGMFHRAMAREGFGERGLLKDYLQHNISLSAAMGKVRERHV